MENNLRYPTESSIETWIGRQDRATPTSDTRTEITITIRIGPKVWLVAMTTEEQERRGAPTNIPILLTNGGKKHSHNYHAHRLNRQPEISVFNTV